MSTATFEQNTRVNSLIKAWEEIQKAKPETRIRNAAQELNVSELELLATRAGEDCIRLTGNWPEFVKRLPELGPVMSLTRNESCILEHKGTFDEVSTFGEGSRAMATVLGPIESRMFFKSWFVGFAVKMEKRNRTLHSVQIFDHAGEAITKIYLQEDSHWEAYETLIRDFSSPDQGKLQEVTPYPEEIYAEEIDQEAFLEDWKNLKDTHAFFGMLRKYKVHRYDAMHLAEGHFTFQLPKASVRQLLQRASGQKLPIMIFTGNRGNIQIHQDIVRTIRVIERESAVWLNVLDPTFNMHLREDHIASVWVVKKPTEDGVVTSVEIYDDNKVLIAQFFGLRKPGNPELKEWVELVDQLQP
ncbi:ChuX/HutX family heme-like substrate-binding protein [Rapidithrix thailandica]|uniref:ChuX/HutX family heme-like substrate-binding protein n=1 Tax=Rapidithrix thailandica TaxID=413964 RepID=A0AAW9SBN9_9BACT